MYFKLDDFIYRNGRISDNNLCDFDFSNLVHTYLVRQIPTNNSESTNPEFAFILSLRVANCVKRSEFVDSVLVVDM